MHDMVRVTLSNVLVLLAITVNYTSGLQWIQLKSGDDIPQNAIPVDDSGKVFVGRSRHYDEVLPAEINTTAAVVQSCDKDIIKYRYEILLNQSNNCRWQKLSQAENVPENIVRGGTASNGEPTYIGRITRNAIGVPNNKRINSVYLTSKTKNKFSSDGIFILVCDDNSIWIDASSGNIPNNTVYGGKSKDKDHIYVARLKSGCLIIPGQVTPELAVASAIYKHERLQSKYCQVLIGEENEYSWVTADDGDIPDYAVVGSKDTTGELMYLALINKTLGYVMPSIAAKMNTTYEVLVRNVM